MPLPQSSSLLPIVLAFEYTSCPPVHRRPPPQVVLSLLLNVLLMGGSMFLWSGGGLLLGAPQAPSAHGRLAGAPGFQACERAGLNETLLDEWGCKLFERVCFDQVRVSSRVCACRSQEINLWRSSPSQAQQPHLHTTLPSTFRVSPLAPPPLNRPLPPPLPPGPGPLRRNMCCFTTGARPPTAPPSHLTPCSTPTPSPPTCCPAMTSRWVRQLLSGGSTLLPGKRGISDLFCGPPTSGAGPPAWRGGPSVRGGFLLGALRTTAPPCASALPVAGTPHYAPKCWDIDIRGPTPLDPPDVWQPAGGWRARLRGRLGGWEVGKACPARCGALHA
jgi:hypothetical protein